LAAVRLQHADARDLRVALESLSALGEPLVLVYLQDSCQSEPDCGADDCINAFLLPSRARFDVVGFTGRTGWMIAFSPEILDNRLRSQSLALARSLAPRSMAQALSGLQVPPQDRSDWEYLCVQLYGEIGTQRDLFESAVRGYLSILLVRAKRLATPKPSLESQQSVVEDVIAFIDACYADHLSLGAIAAQVAVSPTHLTRLMRENTGWTVVRWLEQRRMLEARGLLLSTDLKVEAVAQAVGYGDASYFVRRFRQIHGLPPRRWRDRQRGAELVE
jgi:AraC family transcriptional regulator, transcriptional activator of pobA